MGCCQEQACQQVGEDPLGLRLVYCAGIVCTKRIVVLCFLSKEFIVVFAFSFFLNNVIFTYKMIFQIIWLWGLGVRKSFCISSFDNCFAPWVDNVSSLATYALGLWALLPCALAWLDFTDLTWFARGQFLFGIPLPFP